MAAAGACAQQVPATERVPAAAATGLPSWQQLERDGARIGEIHIVVNPIFDTGDPDEDKLLFRWANALHVPTRPTSIRRMLLFASGQRVSVRLLEETERLLRARRSLYDVQFRPLAYRDGVVDIEVATRDTWTLDVGFSLSRSGGANSNGVQLEEYNLLGTGTAVSFVRSSNVDRSSRRFAAANDQLFRNHTSLAVSTARNSDGKADAFALQRPFYALDTRWAAGVTAATDDRIEPVYNAGKVISSYRRQISQARVYGGWSAGLVDGWVQRVTLGVSLHDQKVSSEPGVSAPPVLPRDEKRVAPYVRFDWIEDRYEREQNRNLIGRPEYFALGFQGSLQVGHALTSLGSTSSATLVSAAVSRGFEPGPQQRLIAAARAVGEVGDGGLRRMAFGGQAHYYRRQAPHWLFFAGGAVDVLARPEPLHYLLLGGDSGLRGYPLRYQGGTRRALFTVEERFFTDIYLWRLFRIGGAAFADVGRAWGGDNLNVANPGWLADAGVGLRIVSARAAFSNVLHVDLAFPLNASGDIRKVQLLVKTKASF